ncbi:MAG: shikimate kinase [Eubacteriales bacterium]|nr:shikimate kinase [Eubacteriales bacterium]
MSGRYGLLGEKLGHSYSPQIHGLLADYEYKLYEVERDKVSDFLKETKLSGMNVTIPYKKTVMDACVSLSDTARKMGCVNTLVKEADGWHGYNTDYYGFCALVRKSGIAIAGKKVLVLGSGGASNTVCRAVEDMNAREVRVISRSGEDNYSNLDKHADAEIIVNTTPVGMYPNNGKSPVDLALFPKLEGVLDVIYNPARTALMLQAEALGIKNAGGLYMLTAQAKRSSELFTGKAVDDKEIGRITDILSSGMRNIILIGMPGCGKSEIGHLLAEQTGRRFIDADEAIEESAGCSIPEIFEKEGEAGFRARETKVLEELGKLSGAVIATGGGCVTRQDNYPLLHQNGILIWIKRDINKLPTHGRPISQSNSLEKLYEIRRSMYESFADVSVDNNKDKNEVVKAVMEAAGL